MESKAVFCLQFTVKGALCDLFSLSFIFVNDKHAGDN